MKLFLIFLASLSSHAGDLIYLSSDTSPTSLEALGTKYQQMLVVDNNGVYLVPSECKAERYFGGASEGVLNIIRGPVRIETVLNTQEVFDKVYAIVDGKTPKDFLEDKEGRGFGGASEVPLVIRNEIQTSVPKMAVKTQGIQIKRPSCQILMDGSGYQIEPLNNGRVYIDGKTTPVSNNTISFH